MGSISERNPIIVAIVIIIFFLILLPVLSVFNFISVKLFAESFMGNIESVFGLNPYLAKAIVVAITIPLLWLFVQALNIFDRRRRNLARVFLVASLVVYYLALWLGTESAWFGRNGEPLKCYVRTDTRIIYHRIAHLDATQIDPETGRKCIPVTRKTLRDLKIIANIMKNEGVHKLDAPTEFFNPRSGAPIVWFKRRENGEYVFFNAPVFDTETGVRTMPMTQEEVKKYKDFIARRRLESERRAREEAAKRDQHERALQLRRKRKAELARLVHMRNLLAIQASSSISASSKAIGMYLVPAGNNGNLAGLAVDKIFVLLGDEQVVLQVWKPAFYKEGYFAKVMSGDLVPAVETGVFDELRKVMLGVVSVECKAANTVVVAGKTCSARFDGRLIFPNGSRKVVARGKGFGVIDEQALDKAVLQLSLKMKERLRQ